MSIKNLSGSCAAGRWIYRTDTGDKHGKVVESAELPEKEDGTELLFKLEPKDPCEINCDHVVAEVVYRMRNNKKVFMTAGIIRDDNWLRKHLIAWAVIQGGK